MAERKSESRYVWRYLDLGSNNILNEVGFHFISTLTSITAKLAKDVVFRTDYTIPNFSREFCSVFICSTNVGNEVVTHGWAKVKEAKGEVTPEHTELLRLEEQARQQGAGLWDRAAKEHVAEIRSKDMKKMFKLGVHSILTTCSKQEFCNSFPSFTQAEKERLYALYVQVIVSLHNNIEDEFDEFCEETKNSFER